MCCSAPSMLRVGTELSKFFTGKTKSLKSYEIAPSQLLVAVLICASSHSIPTKNMNVIQLYYVML